MKNKSSQVFIPFVVLVAIASSCAPQNSTNNGVLDETYIHKYGVAVPPDFWAASGEHGSVVSTMADGVVVTKNYTSGILQGTTTYTFPHSSQVEKEEFYRDGVLIKEMKFFVDGTPKEETVFDIDPQTSTELKTVSSWYFGGTPRCVERYQGPLLCAGKYYTVSNQHDATVENFTGTRLVRDEYGHLVSRENVQNGQLVLRTTYHSNGTPKDKIPYKNGVVEGVKQTFYSAGEPDTVEEWVAGQQHGLTVIYQHGEKFAEVPYLNGSKNGVENRYRDGKDLVQKISWRNNQLHGPSITYVGDTEKTEWYYLGGLKNKGEYDFLINKPLKS